MHSLSISSDLKQIDWLKHFCFRSKQKCRNVLFQKTADQRKQINFNLLLKSKTIISFCSLPASSFPNRINYVLIKIVIVNFIIPVSDKFVQDVVMLIMTNKLFVVIFLSRSSFYGFDSSFPCRASLDHKAAPISVGPGLLKISVSPYS